MAVSVDAFGINPSDWLGLTWRLSLAVFVGGAIGLNRQLAGKAAGLRTHMLVSLGAAMFIVIPLTVGVSSHPDAISRSIQGVATGVGFLGAGEIIHQSNVRSLKPKVKGLTSAAAIWVVAALGMVAGCGLWQASLVGTLLTLLILTMARQIERFMPPRQDDEE